METKKKLSELSDKELLLEAKKRKSSSLMQAVLIGVLIGIIIYSLVKSSFGFFTLIPLFFAYRLIRHSNYTRKELEAVLKERKLK